MDTQILSPGAPDHDSGPRSLLVAGSAHEFGLFGCLVSPEMPSILDGRVAPLMSMLEAVDTTTELQAHDEKGAD